MRGYWLHIVKHSPTAEGYTLAVSPSPGDREALGQSLQSARYDTWQNLSSALSAIGLSAVMLNKISVTVLKQGFDTVRELQLSDDQLGDVLSGNP
jgi:hypothetical protein